MRVLITGASGFVGGWLARACTQRGDHVLGLSRSGTLDPASGQGVALDLADAPGLTRLLAEFEPTVIFHLAALSHVGRSWQDPAKTLDNNVNSSVNLLEAVRVAVPNSRIVWASSGEVYGSDAALPVSEDAPLHPASPYAVSKVAGDLLAGLYTDAHALNIVRARAFAHGGPGQHQIFLVSNIALQAAQAKRDGVDSLRITTGNADTRRDFTDVRDVVRAYMMLTERDVAPGIYNVCSGVSTSTAQRVAALAEAIAPIAVEHVVDPALVRAHEVPDVRGSYERLKAATGWEPRIPVSQTIADAIAWWDSELANRDRP
jgi:GDP-4-dehydro-6-deoxy-D-mannose reductase